MTSIPRHSLSKSTFLYGCQCPKRLWLHKFRPSLRDELTEEQAAVFQSGTSVGLLARELFPGGVDASPATPYEYQKSVALTQRLIRDGVNVIYEAAFQYEGILAAIDILVKKGRKWYAFEVKGTNSIKETHIQDAALQFYVITNSGLPLEDISIVHLNRDYIRKGDLDIHHLFQPESVWEKVQEQQFAISAKAAELKAVLKLKEAPVIPVGDHCFKPYDCDFYGHCSKDLPEEEEEPEETYINQEAIREFLSGLRYPLHFLDFETWSVAVPEQDGHWPYRKIPFQFSLHVLHEQGGLAEHRHYLAEGPHSPLDEFAEQLLSSFEKKGTILVYNIAFEKTVLEELKKDFPQHSACISRIQLRLVDLMTPFRKNFRLPSMQGKYSIKYVLPALVPELSYAGLAIGNGADASTAFYNLKGVGDEEERMKTRQALLEYCGLDTWGMLKIWEKIKEI